MRSGSTVILVERYFGKEEATNLLAEYVADRIKKQCKKEEESKNFDISELKIIERQVPKTT